MSRHHLKIVLVLLVSFVLLYYSIAWAVVRCFHMEAHENYQVALDTDEHITGSNFASSNYVHEYLDCMGSNFHTESLAGSSTPSELFRQMRDVSVHANVLLPLSSAPRNQTWDIRLNAIFDKVSSPSYLIDLPRYLSLSILRI